MYFNSLLASILIVTRNLIGLIFYPYKTMRAISKEDDKIQLYVIFGLVYLYFAISSSIRYETFHPLIISSSTFRSFLSFLITFILVTVYFVAIARYNKREVNISALIYTCAYSLFPSLVWFFVTSFLFFILPPPRTDSFFGVSFSVFFLIFSLTLLWWRIMLLYLSIRFSMATNFYRTLFYILLFLVWFLPYSYLMYRLRLFRIPFI